MRSRAASSTTPRRSSTKPFNRSSVDNAAWVKHGLPALFALLVYGLGLGYLARFSRGPDLASRVS